MSESINQFAGYPIKFKSKVPVKAEFGIWIYYQKLGEGVEHTVAK